MGRMDTVLASQPRPGVGLLTIDRPAKLNSLDPATNAAMAQALQHVARADAGGQDIGELAPAIGGIVAVDRDMLHVGERDAGFPEAVADRFARKAAPVLDAAEALLLDGSDEVAVLDEAGRRVGVIGVEAENVGHLPRSLRSRCMERIISAVTRCAV